MPVLTTRLSSALVLMFMLVCLTARDVLAADTDKEWTVVSSEGAVTVTFNESAGTQSEIHEGMVLHAPFTVRTGSDGHLVISHGEDTLNVRPDSLFDIPEPKPGKQGLVTRINQTLGSILYKVEHRLKDVFEVQTPYLVSVVKGTTFNILVTADSNAVVLLEGRLLVHTPDRTSEVLLEPGQAAVASARDMKIRVQDQQTLSPPVRGPITIVRGDASTTVIATHSDADPDRTESETTGDRDVMSETTLTSPAVGSDGVTVRTDTTSLLSSGDTSVSVGDAGIGGTSVDVGDSTTGVTTSLDTGAVDTTATLDTTTLDTTATLDTTTLDTTATLDTTTLDTTATLDTTTLDTTATLDTTTLDTTATLDTTTLDTTATLDTTTLDTSATLDTTTLDTTLTDTTSTTVDTLSSPLPGP